MTDLMGVVHLCESDRTLRPLTLHRSIAAVPFAGSYRIIDFIMSNMTNSGVENVAVAAFSGFRSVINHLGTAKEWGFDATSEGLFILPPTRPCPPERQGNITVFYDNLDYFERSEQEYAIVSGDNTVANMDLAEPLAFHIERGADLTVICTSRLPDAENGEQTAYVEVAADGKVRSIGFGRKKTGFGSSSMGMYILSRRLLIEMIVSCANRGGSDLLRHAIIPNLSNLKVYAYKHPSYAAIVDSLVSYYRHSMELLNPVVWQDLFAPVRPIHTKRSNSPPVRYERSAAVENALISNGCRIAGEVRNSLLFRRVVVHKEAVIENSVIMQDTEVEKGATIINGIIDKGVRIRPGTYIRGTSDNPVVIEKRTVV